MKAVCVSFWGTAVAVMALCLSVGLSVGLSSEAQAINQVDATKVLLNFVEAQGPSLYEGRDEVGECRVMIYSQNDPQDTQVWLEGTFQAKSGPVAGFPVPFMLSSSPSRSRLLAFQFNQQSLVADVLLPTEGKALRMTVKIDKQSNGSLSTITYKLPTVVRSCQGLHRTM